MNTKITFTALVFLITTTGAFAGAVVAGREGKNEKAPEYFATLVENADAVTLEFMRDEEPVTFSDPDWRRRLAQNFRVADYVRGAYCLCITYPTVCIKTKGVTTLRFSLHHGNRLRTSSAEISGDFIIGDFMGGSFARLIREKTPDKINKIPAFPSQPAGVPAMPLDTRQTGTSMFVPQFKPPDAAALSCDGQPGLVSFSSSVAITSSSTSAASQTTGTGAVQETTKKPASNDKKPERIRKRK
jgi:hypothetical protein